MSGGGRILFIIQSSARTLSPSRNPTRNPTQLMQRRRQKWRFPPLCSNLHGIRPNSTPKKDWTRQHYGHPMVAQDTSSRPFLSIRPLPNPQGRPQVESQWEGGGWLHWFRSPRVAEDLEVLLGAKMEHTIFRNDVRPFPLPTHVCGVHIVRQTLSQASSGPALRSS